MVIANAASTGPTLVVEASNKFSGPDVQVVRSLGTTTKKGACTTKVTLPKSMYLTSISSSKRRRLADPCNPHLPKVGLLR